MKLRIFIGVISLLPVIWDFYPVLADSVVVGTTSTLVNGKRAATSTEKTVVVVGQGKSSASVKVTATQHDVKPADKKGPAGNQKGAQVTVVGGPGTGKPLGLNEHENKEETDKYIVEYTACQEKCKVPLKTECGVNGWWFLNSCHRDCMKVKLSRQEHECDSATKEDFEVSYKCHNKCQAVKEEPECGVDGMWYQNKCRRECYGIPIEDPSYCQQIDTEMDCQAQCRDEKQEADCGQTGEWFESKCLRECLGVPAGKEGKECEDRTKLQRFWRCQEECEVLGTLEKCGKSGKYYQNECHLKCNEDTPGVEGKDCKSE